MTEAPRPKKTRHVLYNSKRPVITEGDVPSDRELQVWQMVSTGKSNKVIGINLNCSESTVKVHLGSLFTKLGVSNRVELALLWHGHDITGQAPRIPTDRDLREMVARDCYERYRQMMGIRTPWGQVAASIKQKWRDNVTMGVTLDGNLFRLEIAT